VHKLRRFDRLQRFASVVVFVFTLFVHLGNGFLNIAAFKKLGFTKVLL
jgi:hypothetical protein